MLIASTSALGHYTALAEDAPLHYAVGPDWRPVRSLHCIPAALVDDESVVIEMWRYNPVTLSDSAYVDPLSLFLACTGETDERVAKAVSGLPGSIGC
jgi:hypothetical protein